MDQLVLVSVKVLKEFSVGFHSSLMDKIEYEVDVEGPVTHIVWSTRYETKNF